MKIWQKLSLNYHQIRTLFHLLTLSTGKLSLGGLPRNSVVRITDRPNLTSVVYRWLKAANQTKQLMIVWRNYKKEQKYTTEMFLCEALKIKKKSGCTMFCATRLAFKEAWIIVWQFYSWLKAVWLINLTRPSSNTTYIRLATWITQVSTRSSGRLEWAGFREIIGHAWAFCTTFMHQ